MALNQFAKQVLASIAREVIKSQLKKKGIDLNFIEDQFRQAKSQAKQAAYSFDDHFYVRSEYAILGLKQDAPPELIKKQYRILASKYHPDHNPSPDAARRFNDVVKAFNSLKNAGIVK